MSEAKYIYRFSEGSANLKDLLGGKGANLGEMTRIGLPVPTGFTITTQTCLEYYQRNQQLWPELQTSIKDYLHLIEQENNKVFGDSENPLLLSVRSGAAISMPGMMDTILNLGLNDNTVSGLYKMTGDLRFVYDCYRRFIQMFGNVVLKVEHYKFEHILASIKQEEGFKNDAQLSAENLQTIVELQKELILNETGQVFPSDPYKQLFMAIEAVFDSWNNRRALAYRKIHKIPDELGTAVTVQTMVFGNSGSESGTGVAFTRNPNTGEKKIYGEYLLNAQGEDVVAGIRTPNPVSQLQHDMPKIFEQLLETANLLEHHYQDMQDIEFTVEKEQLYLLQTRTGKRTAKAAVKIAVDMAKENLITKEQALLRIDADNIDQILHRAISPDLAEEPIARGLPASPGAAIGKLVFDADRVANVVQSGDNAILMRPETTPEDIHGLAKAAAVVTSRGGMTSHAAVVARGMGKACVCGCDALQIDLSNNTVTIGNLMLKEGDTISVDGGTGRIFTGEVPMIEADTSVELEELLDWADEHRVLGVRANADTPEDAERARLFGAEGIGLCRTEHMFMSAERLPIVRDMILAETSAERRVALDRLLPMQIADFSKILESMSGLPVTIRLLDPPLHEFLPSMTELVKEIATLEATGAEIEDIAPKRELLRKVRMLAEQNPMLGHRGCRLAITFPEIYEMQVNAITEAAYMLQQEGVATEIEIMIPLIGNISELRIMKALVQKIITRKSEEFGKNLDCRIGTMIELPRACLIAEQIASYADFFSFGTNDLTQTTFGFSRDDAEGKFLHEYLHQKIIQDNPFAVIDEEGVGRLVEIACQKAHSVKPDLKLGICGEHGGNPQSIDFFHRIGLYYVSCSPFRVPVARLAAAQAVLINS